MRKNIKTWQERMPAPSTEMRCVMNCYPRHGVCHDCEPVTIHGDPIAARDAEIAELRAALDQDGKTPATRTISIWKKDGDEYYTKDVCLAPCPHCHGEELIASEVEIDGRSPDKYPSAVHCGGCGARGPWSKTEEGAVTAWNKTAGVATTSITDWRHVPMPDPDDYDDGLPF